MIIIREVDVKEITEVVARLCKEANFNLNLEVEEALRLGLALEASPLGREVLEQLIENAKIAYTERLPICQDTGVAVVFVEVGQDVHLVGGDFSEAIQEGVRRGYKEGYLRKSIVKCPFRRQNTGDNTPAIIHIDIVSGDRIKIIVAPKGGGSENMSMVKMVAPSAGVEGVKRLIVEFVKEAGANPCPPIVVGVGIGGNLEYAPLLAKKALLRPLGQPNSDPMIEQMEKDILKEINKSGIGPQGFGGRLTAMAVHIEVFPCHIASLPVAININCHAHRHKEAII